MSYDLYEQGPSAYIPVLIVSLVITMVAYGAFPVIFAKIRKKQITKRKYKTLCFVFNFLVMFLFIAMNGEATGAPYIMWTIVFSNLGISMLDKKMVLKDSNDINSNETETKKNLKEPNSTEIAIIQNDSILNNDFVVTKNDNTTIEYNNYCRKCGEKLTKDSKFCHKCGTKIVDWSEYNNG